MDTVFIEGLEVETLIGIYTGERDAPQPVVIDLELGFNNTRPAASGRIEDGVDYASVVTAVRAFVASADCGLLEQLAEDCCAMLRQRFAGVRCADLRIDKPAAARALGCRHVGVRIQRQFAYMTRAWLLMLGSNLDSDARVHAALTALRELGPVTRLTTIRRLPAHGDASAQDYFNALATLETDMDRAALVANLKRIERELGRERSSVRVAIDIDLLACRDGRHWVADTHAVEKNDIALPPGSLLLREAGITVE